MGEPWHTTPQNRKVILSSALYMHNATSLLAWDKTRGTAHSASNKAGGYSYSPAISKDSPDAQLEQAQNWHEVQPYRSLTSGEHCSPWATRSKECNLRNNYEKGPLAVTRCNLTRATTLQRSRFIYCSVWTPKLQPGTISPCYSPCHSIIYLSHDARTCQPGLWPSAKPTEQHHAFMKHCMCSYTTLHCTSWGYHALGDLHAPLLPSQFKTGAAILTSLSGSLCQGLQGIHPQKVVLMWNCI